MNRNTLKNEGLVLLGGFAGGFIGFWVFFWVVGQGFYGLIIPGAMVGLVAGFFKSKTPVSAVVCGIFALFLGFYTEWCFAPFIKNNSFFYLLTHFYQLRPITLIMIAVGAFFGFWAPFRHTSANAKGSIENKTDSKH